MMMVQCGCPTLPSIRNLIASARTVASRICYGVLDFWLDEIKQSSTKSATKQQHRIGRYKQFDRSSRLPWKRGASLFVCDGSARLVTGRERRYTERWTFLDSERLPPHS